MTNFSKASQDEVSKNQVIRSNVAKTQQPDAERLIKKNLIELKFFKDLKIFKTNSFF